MKLSSLREDLADIIKGKFLRAAGGKGVINPVPGGTVPDQKKTLPYRSGQQYTPPKKIKHRKYFNMQSWGGDTGLPQQEPDPRKPDLLKKSKRTI